jgi:hypothetical protein
MHFILILFFFLSCTTRIFALPAVWPGPLGGPGNPSSGSVGYLARQGMVNLFFPPGNLEEYREGQVCGFVVGSPGDGAIFASLCAGGVVGLNGYAVTQWRNGSLPRQGSGMMTSLALTSSSSTLVFFSGGNAVTFASTDGDDLAGPFALVKIDEVAGSIGLALALFNDSLLVSLWWREDDGSVTLVAGKAVRLLIARGVTAAQVSAGSSLCIVSMELVGAVVGGQGFLVNLTDSVHSFPTSTPLVAVPQGDSVLFGSGRTIRSARITGPGSALTLVDLVTLPGNTISSPLALGLNGLMGVCHGPLVSVVSLVDRAVVWTYEPVPAMRGTRFTGISWLTASEAILVTTGGRLAAVALSDGAGEPLWAALVRDAPEAPGPAAAAVTEALQVVVAVSGAPAVITLVQGKPPSVDDAVMLPNGTARITLPPAFDPVGWWLESQAPTGERKLNTTWDHPGPAFLVLDWQKGPQTGDAVTIVTRDGARSDPVTITIRAPPPSSPEATVAPPSHSAPSAQPNTRKLIILSAATAGGLLLILALAILAARARHKKKQRPAPEMAQNLIT